MGGLISFFIEIIRTHSVQSGIINPSSQPADLYAGLPLFLREIVSRIPINIIDRIISVFAGFGIAYVIGKTIERISRR